MRVGQFLAYMARLKNDDGADLRRRIRLWLERVGLAEVETKRCEELSKGMQQKLQFLAAIIHRPDLIILDEPFSGLDPVNQRLLRDLVREEHERGATVIFSTHIMIHAEQLCDHVIMVHRGVKVIDDTIAEIRARASTRSLLFEPPDPNDDVGVLASGADTAAAIRAVVAAVAPARIELRRPTLEDVFVDIVTGDAAGGEAATLRAAVRDEDASAEVRR